MPGGEKRQIAAILSSPVRDLPGVQKDLLWKFRYSLTENKRALNKFLRSVDWADATEVKHTGVGTEKFKMHRAKYRNQSMFSRHIPNFESSISNVFLSVLQPSKIANRSSSSILFELFYQTKSALALLDVWAPIDVDDALELLTKQFANDGACVRFLFEAVGCSLFLFLATSLSLSQFF